jgi:hypothetical protein
METAISIFDSGKDLTVGANELQGMTQDIRNEVLWVRTPLDNIIVILFGELLFRLPTILIRSIGYLWNTVGKFVR